jgi:hypothetical protein
MVPLLQGGRVMPSIHQIVDREVALQHNGVTIYHAYKDDWFDNPLTYWFALSPEDEADEFDVRDLPDRYQQPCIEDTLKAAIEAGLLKNPEGRAA